MLAWNGTLIRLTQDSEPWLKRPEKKRGFDPETAYACIDTAAGTGMNLLILSMADTDTAGETGTARRRGPTRCATPGNGWR
jgi:hypothetical protein